MFICNSNNNNSGINFSYVKLNKESLLSFNKPKSGGILINSSNFTCNTFNIIKTYSTCRTSNKNYMGFPRYLSQLHEKYAVGLEKQNVKLNP